MSYDPYKIALSLLQGKLNIDEIKLITKDKDDSKTSEYGEGFNVDKLKKWLIEYQKKGFKKERTTKQFSGYEILQCLRKSYYNRMGTDYDEQQIAQFPYSTIKATMGHVAEQLLLTMYNEINPATKFRNSVEIRWECDKELGLLYPFVGVIDAISYDEELMADSKFTDGLDGQHTEQVLLYAMAWEEKHKKKTFKACEVIYLNSMLNSVSVIRTNITDETRRTKFEAAKSRLVYYNTCLKNKTIPDRELDKCSFCCYKKVCSNTNSISMVNTNSNDDTNISNVDENPLKEGYTETKKGTEIKSESIPKTVKSNMKILI